MITMMATLSRNCGKSNLRLTFPLEMLFHISLKSATQSLSGNLYDNRFVYDKFPFIYDRRSTLFYVKDDGLFSDDLLKAAQVYVSKAGQLLHRPT